MNPKAHSCLFLFLPLFLFFSSPDLLAESPALGELEFSLLDANGLEVKSQDYKGVPLFIAFGAAW